MMWPLRSRLILSIIAASVVDFPEPVGPVTSTRPRGFSAIFAITPRKPEVGEGADVERDLPDHHRDAAALLEAVAAEAREVLDAEREVELVLHLEPLLLVLGQHRVRELQRVLGREHVFDVRVRDVAVDAQLGALAGGDVQVRRVALDHLLEQRAQVDACRCGELAGAVIEPMRVACAGVRERT